MSERTFSLNLPEREFTWIYDEACRCEISRQQVIIQAIRMLNTIRHHESQGHRMAFIDQNGDLIKETPIGCPDLGD